MFALSGQLCVYEQHTDTTEVLTFHGCVNLNDTLVVILDSAIIIMRDTRVCPINSIAGRDNIFRLHFATRVDATAQVEWKRRAVPTFSRVGDSDIREGALLLFAPLLFSNASGANKLDRHKVSAY